MGKFRKNHVVFGLLFFLLLLPVVLYAVQNPQDIRQRAAGTGFKQATVSGCGEIISQPAVGATEGDLVFQAPIRAKNGWETHKQDGGIIATEDLYKKMWDQFGGKMNLSRTIEEFTISCTMTIRYEGDCRAEVVGHGTSKDDMLAQGDRTTIHLSSNNGASSGCEETILVRAQYGSSPPSSYPNVTPFQWPKGINSKWCSDSDGGLIYDQTGIVTNNFDPAKGERQTCNDREDNNNGNCSDVDTCTNGVLTEYYCEGGLSKSQQFTCPSGCADRWSCKNSGTPLPTGVPPNGQSTPPVTNEPTPSTSTPMPTSGQPTPIGITPTPTLGATACYKDADCSTDKFCPACKDPGDSHAQCVPQTCTTRNSSSTVQLTAQTSCFNGKPTISVSFPIKQEVLGYSILFNPSLGLVSNLPITMPIVFYTDAFSGVKVFPGVEYHVMVRLTTATAPEESAVVTVQTRTDCGYVTPTIASITTPTITPLRGDTATVNVLLKGVGSNPSTRVRTADIRFYDENGKQVVEKKTIPLLFLNGVFTMRINTRDITPGNYTVKVKIPGYLEGKVPGIVQVTQNGVIQLPTVVLRPGDLTGDNQLTTADSNLLQACFDATKGTCGDPYRAIADYNGDGKVDILDYNMYHDSVIRREGD